MARNALGRGLSALIPAAGATGAIVAREYEAAQTDVGQESADQDIPAGQSAGPARFEADAKAFRTLENEPSPPAPGKKLTAEGHSGDTARNQTVGGQSEEPVRQIDIDLMDPNPYQPRTSFSEESLEELAESIKHSGLIQPVLARAINDRFQIIAGERRWRAAQRAELHRIPVIVRHVNDRQAMEMALIENVQREDLNPIDEATAFNRLIEEFHMKQEEVAVRTGKDRAVIANSVRLLKLDPTIQQLVARGTLSAGHGRALLSISDPSERTNVARYAVERCLTVRHIENWGREKTKPAPEIDANLRQALKDLEHIYGTKIKLKPLKGKESGELVFEYYSRSDIMRIYDQLVERK